MVAITRWTEVIALLLLMQGPAEKPKENPLMERARESLTKMAKNEAVQRQIFAQRIDVLPVGIVRFDPYLSISGLSATLPPLTGVDGQPLDAREKVKLQIRSDFTMTYGSHLAGRYAIVMVCEVESPVEGHRRNRRLPLQFTKMDGRGENGSVNHPWSIEFRPREAGEYEVFRMILAVPAVEGLPILLLAARIEQVTVAAKRREQAATQDREQSPSTPDHRLSLWP